MIRVIYTMIIAAAISAYAQPVINEANLPVIGTKAEFVYYDATDLSAGPSGANQTWTFTNLQLDPEGASDITEFVSPSGAKGNENFPDATIAEKTDTAYSFYKISNNEMVRLGTGYDEGNEILTDYQLMYKVPFTYGYSFTDDFAGSLFTMGNEAQREGSIEGEVDAYGSITIEDKTYHNAVRLKYYMEITDEMDMVIEGIPLHATMETKLTSYSWIIPGEYYPVFTFTEGTIVTSVAGMDFEDEIRSAEAVFYDVMNPPVISMPEPQSPPNNSESLQSPVTLEWTESELIQQGGIQQDQNIRYMVELEEFGDSETNTYYDTTKINTITYSDILKSSYTYKWKVKAFADDTESDWSEQWTFTIADDFVTPETPVLLTPENNSEEISINLTFTWEDNGDAEKWIITVDDNPQFSMPLIETEVMESSYELISVLDFNKTYYWKVKAVAGENMSDWSDVWSFSTVMEQLPEPPMLSHPQNNATGISITPVLEWAADGNATKWNVIVSDNSQLQTIIADVDVTENSYALENELENNTIYYWAVKAGNDAGWSDSSPVYSFTTEEESSVIFSNNNNLIQIMPNPANEYIITNTDMISSEILSAYIININGEIIRAIDFKAISGRKIDISDLTTGKYFLKLNAGKSYILPFIKE